MIWCDQRSGRMSNELGEGWFCDVFLIMMGVRLQRCSEFELALSKNNFTLLVPSNIARASCARAVSFWTFHLCLIPCRKRSQFGAFLAYLRRLVIKESVFLISSTALEWLFFYHLIPLFFCRISTTGRIRYTKPSSAGNSILAAIGWEYNPSRRHTLATFCGFIDHNQWHFVWLSIVATTRTCCGNYT